MSKRPSLSPTLVGPIGSLIFCLALRIVSADDPQRSSEPWKRQVVLEGHTDAVTAVAFSPDQKLLASGSEDRTVRIWEIASGKPVAELNGHTAPIRCIAFSPDGRILATGSAGVDFEQQRQIGELKLWDVAARKEMMTPIAHPGTWVDSLAFSGDGTFLAIGGCLRTVDMPVVTIWEVAIGKQLASIDDFLFTVQSLAFSPDGNTLATFGAHENDHVSLWDWRVTKKVLSINPEDRCKWLVFSSDGRTLMLGLWKRITFLDVQSGDIRKTLPIASTLAITRDGKLSIRELYTNEKSQDGRFVEEKGGFDVLQDGLDQPVAHADLGRKVWTAAFSSNDKTLAVACRGKERINISQPRKAGEKGPEPEGDRRGVVEVWTQQSRSDR